MRAGLRPAASRLAIPVLLAGLLAALATGGCSKRDIDKVVKDRDRSLTPQQLYEKGQTYLRKGRYYRARTTLEKILARSDAGAALLGDANLAIADAYYYDGGVINVAEAMSRYTSFLTFYPAHPRADYAQYQLGLAYLKQALGPDKDQATTRQALEAFRKVALDHPESGFADAARDRAEECRERLASADAQVGLFYLKRGGWAGAADRFRSALELAPRHRDRDEILFHLATALERSDKQDEALIYYQKIVDEYPNGRYAGDARQAIEQAASEATAAAGESRKKSSAKATGPREGGSGTR